MSVKKTILINNFSLIYSYIVAISFVGGVR